jgi:hypothetical protein
MPVRRAYHSLHAAAVSAAAAAAAALNMDSALETLDLQLVPLLPPRRTLMPRCMLCPGWVARTYRSRRCRAPWSPTQ